MRQPDPSHPTLPTFGIHSNRPSYFRSLAEAVRDPDDLIARLELPATLRESVHRAAAEFPLLVPRSFLARMRPGDPADPLLRQVLPIDAEIEEVPGFTRDAVGDGDARRGAGFIQKYEGRALLIAAGACAVHCRYCFRRHFPYGEDPAHADDWEPALRVIREDRSLSEMILSGGDPLMLTDGRLAGLIARLDEIPHLKRVRIHTRLPIVLPDRVTDEFLATLDGTRLTPVVVVHANHANELVDDCERALRRLSKTRATLLNQAVLLRGVNDDVEALAALSERLIELGVTPYYLHQLDRVAGAAHFEVSERRGRELMAELWRRLPGYLVPRYVREIKGEPGKSAIP